MSDEIKVYMNEFNHDAMSGWINVKERLPEKVHFDVLITNGKHIGIAHLGHDKTLWFDYLDPLHHKSMRQDSITHWMPLPEPPK